MSDKLNSNFSFNMGIRIVIFKFEVFKFKLKDVFYFRIENHFWKCFRFPCQLQVYLFHVIAVYVGIAKSVDEISRAVAAYLCHHQGEEGI